MVLHRAIAVVPATSKEYLREGSAQTDCSSGGIGVVCSLVANDLCFPNLPPMLLRGFESRLELESLGFSMWHFLKLVARGFLRVLRFPPLLHRFNGSANKIKLK